MEFEFMSADTVLPPCMPLPAAMLRLPISSTAKVMYARLLNTTLTSFLSALPSSDRVGQFPVTPFRAFRLSGGSLQSFRSPSGCPWRTRPAASAPVAFPASAWPPVPPSCRTSGRCLSGCPLATARAVRRMLAHTVGRCAVAPSCCCSFLQSSSGQWRDDADRVVVLVQND